MTAHRDKRTLLALILPLREKGSTMNQIGREIGLSKSRVSQLLRLERTLSPLSDVASDGEIRDT